MCGHHSDCHYPTNHQHIVVAIEINHGFQYISTNFRCIKKKPVDNLIDFYKVKVLLLSGRVIVEYWRLFESLIMTKLKHRLVELFLTCCDAGIMNQICSWTLERKSSQDTPFL